MYVVTLINYLISKIISSIQNEHKIDRSAQSNPLLNKSKPKLNHVYKQKYTARKWKVQENNFHNGKP